MQFCLRLFFFSREGWRVHNAAPILDALDMSFPAHCAAPPREPPFDGNRHPKSAEEQVEAEAAGIQVSEISPETDCKNVVARSERAVSQLWTPHAD